MWIDGNAYAPSVVLSNGSASLSLPGPQVSSGELGSVLSVGSHEIGVSYAGDEANPNNYSPQLFTANQVPVIVLALPPTPPTPVTLKLTIGTSANPSALGQSLTITATFVASGGTPTGLVQFYDGSTLLGMVAVTNN